MLSMRIVTTLGRIVRTLGIITTLGSKICFNWSVLKVLKLVCVSIGLCAGLLLLLLTRA